MEGLEKGVAYLAEIDDCVSMSPDYENMTRDRSHDEQKHTNRSRPRDPDTTSSAILGPIRREGVSHRLIMVDKTK